VAEVQAALSAGRAPPSKFRITGFNWNDPRWIEQPLSGYMTTHPSEDLPEAIAAYVNFPELLRVRSPRRYEFLETHRAVIAPYLVLSLRLTEEQLGRVIDTKNLLPWLQPVPAGGGSTSTRLVNFMYGPQLEIRF
jgi:hypothetical protein